MVTLEYPITKTPDVLLKQIAEQAKSRLKLEGDSSNGKITGSVGGTYSFRKGIVSITLTKKPALISWSYLITLLNNWALSW